MEELPSAGAPGRLPGPASNSILVWSHLIRFRLSPTHTTVRRRPAAAPPVVTRLGDRLGEILCPRLGRKNTSSAGACGSPRPHDHTLPATARPAPASGSHERRTVGRRALDRQRIPPLFTTRVRRRSGRRPLPATASPVCATSSSRVRRQRIARPAASYAPDTSAAHVHFAIAFREVHHRSSSSAAPTRSDPAARLSPTSACPISSATCPQPALRCFRPAHSRLPAS